ncbi:hypothetical protein GPECTOR_116g354 [Gonium pectorale]|uniref:AAA+ ATPase domain-containing protein n=1 Tax=Gonium pectorale TaxID=33097 RepID=A0A150FYZ2_GONPE|nr:hypothetical protein GPECTOR_116g354 [Gonium pectorale]|eukprot:KXZ42822.1 hypothetical protein GPECTOR_116g354 [Gonium pectorale]
MSSQFGPPCLAAYLADGSAPRLPAGASWIALSPDTLAAARISAGTIILVRRGGGEGLVGVSARVVPQGPAAAAASPAALRSPGPGTPLAGGSSAFGPAPELLSPDPATGAPPQPQSLWRLCGLRLGLPDPWDGESESSLRGIFAAASALAPSLVFIDEVDALAPARGGGGGGSAHHAAPADVASRLVTAMLTLLDGAPEESPSPPSHHSASPSSCSSSSPSSSQPPPPRPRPVVVIAATNRPDALDPALRRPGRLERELEVGVPSAAARLEILEARLRSVRHRLSAADVAALAAAAHGFVSADLAALVDEAALGALRRLVAARERRRQQIPQRQHGGGGGQAGAKGPAEGQAEGQEAAAEEAEEEAEEEAVVTLQDFKTAETRVRPSALREVAVEVPDVRWSDIGGVAAVKQALREAVEWPHKAAGALSRLGAQPPRGVLLYGPPGCSKTLLARAVAAEAGLNFLAVKAGELASKYVGESEKVAMRHFEAALTTVQPSAPPSARMTQLYERMQRAALAAS